MIKINIIKSDNKINKITIKGHAIYDDFGKDIVCSSVSSIVITTINGILSLSKSIDYVEEDGLISITVIKDDDNTFKLLDNMISMLRQLEEDYPKHVKIN
jgi:uncharacterized protein YsxB (DUF464 family)